MENLNFNEFVSWGFQGLVAGGIIYAASSITKIKESVEELNKSIATLLERSAWQGKEIESHDERLTSLETTKRSGRNKGA